ncbi:signal peptidase I [Streptomyces sp. TLI_55]|uniref:signal peptidase I n=1 Tax=Streptomyces sp. TLI_55 TaxID=1938861 RepID=UPI000BC97746|nr:signal peptidase I [Streptomyces sp. TLI_55]SNX61642.1 signal peptidase I [Streptomyces sp. TLI_55]
MSGKGRGLGIAAIVVGLVGLLLALGGVGYTRHAFGAATVSSESMTPTYGPGDRVMYERVDASEVRRGDVVMLSAPDRYHSDGLVMQRVIGVGGDRVKCCTGDGPGARITVNGKPLEEPYLKDGDVYGGFPMPYDVRVPEGRLFLLGDHRSSAADSRAFLADHGGTLPASAIKGRVLDGYTAPGVLGAAIIAGAVLVLVGVGLGIAALVVRRRARAAVPPAPPWAMQV